MLRHEFRPGRAVAGLTMLVLAGGYAGDAAGDWEAPWTFFLGVFLGGLWLAATATWTAYMLRRRRDARKASTENMEAPASTKGSHAIK
ncbi:MULTISPECIES: hypothetical protein [Streptomyces]|uniref:hypothetical protein n=1 Tax=Streptomyces TaxID=1883 RepID=UPI000D516EC3|nr:MULTISPECIES: hypothetical protein [Streptomyces]MCD9902430.1 hypothetical protein [Streptomyces sp. MT29]NDZ65787.1 hypothetical protein [Streptomyces cyaneofuscatus]PVC89119.1 hypothetical protein DBP19_21050 [Streptomyces sp. CS090A]WOP09417.1 hypothetical protein R2B67_12945 [Streptomyces cyaneofuscatus]WRO12239.1 hypothetical protein SJX93_22745 [Streptomyces cyaneofuscatus]